MTYINLSRHDARLDGDLRLRLAWHLQIVSKLTTMAIVSQIRNSQILDPAFMLIEDSVWLWINKDHY
jgi:hypothetical protein